MRKLSCGSPERRSRLIEALGNLQTVSAGKSATSLNGRRPHALEGKETSSALSQSQERQGNLGGTGP